MRIEFIRLEHLNPSTFFYFLDMLLLDHFLTNCRRFHFCCNYFLSENGFFTTLTEQRERLNRAATTTMGTTSLSPLTTEISKDNELNTTTLYCTRYLYNNLATIGSFKYDKSRKSEIKKNAKSTINPSITQSQIDALIRDQSTNQ